MPRPTLRVVYILGEVFGVSSADGVWICGTTEAAYRKRLSRARAAIREFVAEYCGLVAPARARCHCRNRVAAAISLGRIDPHVGDQPSSAVIDAATAEMEALYDAAQLERRGRPVGGGGANPIAPALQSLPDRRSVVHGAGAGSFGPAITNQVPISLD